MSQLNAVENKTLKVVVPREYSRLIKINFIKTPKPLITLQSDVPQNLMQFRWSYKFDGDGACMTQWGGEGMILTNLEGIAPGKREFENEAAEVYLLRCQKATKWKLFSGISHDNWALL